LATLQIRHNDRTVVGDRSIMRLRTEEKVMASSQMIQQLTSGRAIVAIYWMLFWLLNGLDKFFNYEHFFGVDRDKQFVAYFASLDLPASLAGVSLYTFGVIEISLGIVFLIIVTHGAKISGLNRFAFKATMVVFIIYSVGDILFGDRGELREHGIYMILTILSFQFFLFTAVEKSGDAELENV
jgi:hypothetical protein